MITIQSAARIAQRRALLRRSSLPVSLRERRLLSASSNAALTIPPSNKKQLVNLQTASKIEGEESQIATITLQKGQAIRAESGSMLYMTHGVEMETSSNLSAGMKRFMTGQSLFVSDFSYNGEGTGTVALGTAFPSKILRLNLDDFDGRLICQKGAYLASNKGVDIEMAFTKTMTAGFFGGQGFVLQSLQGQGDVLLQAGGALVRKDMVEGETLRISSGNLVAMTSTIEYDVTTMKGFKNVMFGGEGLFITTLKGPGTVWLQGLPPDRMISEIARRVPAGGGLGIPIMMGGGGGSEAGEGVEGTEVEGADDMVAASDAAIEADRQATVAASGATMDSSSDQPVDPESASSLFGDAAPKDSSSPPPLEEEPTSWTGSSEDSSSFDQGGFSEETTFSTEDDFDTGEFQDDTSFSNTFKDSSSGAEDLFESGASSEEAQDTASSVLGTLWDLFTGGDD